MKHKHAQTHVPIHKIIAERWSGRAYDANKQIEMTCILAMMEAARWAPSCFDEEPWRFIILDRFRNPKRWQDGLDCLMGGNQKWAKDAPLMAIVIADTLSSYNQQPNPWAEYDTGAAAENFCLQATALGLKTRQIGGFHADRIRSTFNLPAQFKPMSVIIAGYPGKPAQLEKKLADAEQAPRSRNPIADHFFIDDWGHPIQFEND